METYKRVNKLLGTVFESDRRIDWSYISIHEKLPECFIREFQDKINWIYISKYQKLSENFIREFQDKIDWDWISAYQGLSECFIREFRFKVNWSLISVHQKLTECFIKEFQHQVDWWAGISIHQKLSEGFIREFQDKVCWSYISKYQRLSEDFIREFRYNVNWDLISKHQKLSDGFIGEFFTGKLNYTLLNDSWHYKSTKYKKQEVKDTGLYKCYDDYFIAYKGIRSDRYSAFNFQYKYEPGGIYESWCDCSDDNNSFGLSVWTEEKAEDYCNELVVKVKIRYEDVGRVVHSGGKIRCFKIEILN